MRPEDLQNQLDELWKCVAASPSPTSFGIGTSSATPVPSGDISAMTREASLDAIAFIRKQHDAEVLRFRHFAELKDRTMNELRDQLRGAESEIQQLRGKSSRGEEALLAHMESVASELEDARKMLKLQEDRFHEEESLLRGIAERTREQLAGESGHHHELQSQWNEREQQYLLDIRELQARSEKAAEESASMEGRSRQSMGELREAKNAIEKTLGELLKERRDREISDKEREKALGRVRDVQHHMKELQALWDAERKQWQELWDREKSTWDSQKKEYSQWEGKLRQERQEWHKELSTMRERESKFHEVMAESLRKSSQVGEKITSMLQFAASKAVDVISARPGKAAGAVAPTPGVAPPRPLDWRKLLAGTVAAVLLLSAYPVWKHVHRLRFELVESYALVAESPTGIAFDGNVLWLTEWDGRLTSLDPEQPSEVLFRQTIKRRGVYHPNSVAIWGDALYTLDTAQARILRHSLTAPAKVDLDWPSPGPAPIVLAHDGQNLWSYDAATRAVYRHLGEGKESQVEAHKMEFDILPSAMTWFKDELWIYDIKGRQIMIFKRDGKTLDLVRSKKFDTPLQSILLTYRADDQGKQRLELWGLSVPEEGDDPPTLKKYRVKR